MKTYKTYIAILATGLLFFGCHQSDPADLKYELVWSDEFDGNTVDEDKWEFLIGNGHDFGIPGWGNNERQYYKKENATVSDGILTITAKREFAGTNFEYKYTSVRMRTQDKGDWNQGRFEARIRMDKEAGLWHAFWMLPSNPDEPWPVSGEIDIMEFVGNRPQEVLFNIHYQDIFGNHGNTGQTKTKTEPFDFADFHVYAVEWDDFGMKWFVDDEETFSVSKDDPALNGVWPYDQAFHIILNVAIGGNLTGDIVNDIAFPSEMQVDYVRVYQLTN